MDLKSFKIILLVQYRSWNKIGLFQSLLKPIPFEMPCAFFCHKATFSISPFWAQIFLLCNSID
jgi:hypothetical protein